jgi:hypothetical protein
MIPHPVPSTGCIRLRLQTEAGRWLNVGLLTTLTGARRLAEDLVTQPTVD